MIDERFTIKYYNVLKKSYITALEKNEDVNIGHFLFSLLTEKGCLGGEILKKNSFKPEDFLTTKKNQTTKIKEYVNFSEQAIQVIQTSVIIAYKYQHIYIGTEHLLASILQNKDIEKFITKKNLIDSLYNQTQTILRNTSKFPEIIQTFDLEEVNFDFYEESEDISNANLNINNFVIDLTDPYIQKNIDPVIGREKEIERIINILARRTKNNPILLGEPGVGKTAIIEGLAKKILQQEVPAFLLNKKILSLDLTAVIAGTMYRGEFEARLKQIIDEVKSNPNIILFIDEIHNIIGAGSTSNSMDAANILKPALARGQIRCIGATTFEEYKKHIEKDSALNRRFQSIHIKEPSSEKTFEIIKGIKSNYEKFHNVNIPDEIIKYTVQLSKKFINNSFFPDKAIDIIDEACSKLSITQSNIKLQKQIQELKEKLQKNNFQKHKALIYEDYNKAILLQTKEKQILQKLQKLNSQYNEFLKNNKKTISKSLINQIISEKTQIPLSKIQGQNQNILNLPKILKKHIIGQDNVINQIYTQLLKSDIVFNIKQKPIASFLFVGPSGVGKTQTAKILAQEFFGTKDKLIQINMSEFSESFNLSKLIGSPAGYVGYREGALLSDKIFKNPHCVVLFDEIEKAHKQVYNILLQILDEGFILDAIGKKIDFTNTIIIMTSNIGQELFSKNNIGFSQSKTKILFDKHNELQNLLKQHFSTEFLNRIDKILLFNPLNFKDLKKIAKIEIEKINQSLKEKGINIQIEPKVLNFICKKTIEEQNNARILQQKIDDLIKVPLAEKILKKTKVESVKINLDKGKIKII